MADGTKHSPAADAAASQISTALSNVTELQGMQLAKMNNSELANFVAETKRISTAPNDLYALLHEFAAECAMWRELAGVDTAKPPADPAADYGAD